MEKGKGIIGSYDVTIKKNVVVGEICAVSAFFPLKLFGLKTEEGHVNQVSCDVEGEEILWLCR